MNAQLDSSMTASFLESGQTLASAGNVAAVILGVAGATVHLAIVGSCSLPQCCAGSSSVGLPSASGLMPCCLSRTGRRI